MTSNINNLEKELWPDSFFFFFFNHSSRHLLEGGRFQNRAALKAKGPTQGVTCNSFHVINYGMMSVSVATGRMLPWAEILFRHDSGVVFCWLLPLGTWVHHREDGKETETVQNFCCDSISWFTQSGFITFLSLLRFCLHEHGGKENCANRHLCIWLLYGAWWDPGSNPHSHEADVVVKVIIVYCLRWY